MKHTVQRTADCTEVGPTLRILFYYLVLEILESTKSHMSTWADDDNDHRDQVTGKHCQRKVRVWLGVVRVLGRTLRRVSTVVHLCQLNTSHQVDTFVQKTTEKYKTTEEDKWLKLWKVQTNIAYIYIAVHDTT